MKNKNSKYKPECIIDGYSIKKQLMGGFKVIEYSHYSNEKFSRKRTLHKNLSITDAENIVYELNKKLK